MRSIARVAMTVSLDNIEEKKKVKLKAFGILSGHVSRGIKAHSDWLVHEMKTD